MNWFLFDDPPVAHATTAIVGDERSARCGLTVRGNVLAREVDEDELYPPEACAKCQRLIAFDDAVEETLEDAVARGYLPAEVAIAEMDPDSRLSAPPTP